MVSQLNKFLLFTFFFYCHLNNLHATDTINLNIYKNVKATVAGVELKIHLPVRPYEAQQLGIYLHGDNAKGHNEDWYKDLKDFAIKKGIVFVSVRSPNKYSWWSRPGDMIYFAYYQENLNQALEWIHEQLPNLKRDQYLFGSASGGSTFLSSVFIPSVGYKYPGIYALMCGGARVVKGDLSKLKPEKYNIYYEHGTEDFLYDRIDESISDYKQVLKVKRYLHEGKKHCDFPTFESIKSIWSKHILSSSSSENDPRRQNVSRSTVTRKPQRVNRSDRKVYTLEDIRVEVKYGEIHNGQQDFMLYLNAPQALLDNIKSVNYFLHPTYHSDGHGFDALDSSSQFSSGWISTWANNWSTGRIRITLKDDRVFDLPGVFIKY